MQCQPSHGWLWIQAPQASFGCSGTVEMYRTLLSMYLCSFENSVLSYFCEQSGNRRYPPVSLWLQTHSRAVSHHVSGWDCYLWNTIPFSFVHFSLIFPRFFLFSQQTIIWLRKLCYLSKCTKIFFSFINLKVENYSLLFGRPHILYFPFSYPNI